MKARVISKEGITVLHRQGYAGKAALPRDLGAVCEAMHEECLLGVLIAGRLPQKAARLRACMAAARLPAGFDAGARDAQHGIATCANSARWV